MLGPRKMGIQEKLSHLSLSISTWHLGRAWDKEAAYPCGQGQPRSQPQLKASRLQARGVRNLSTPHTVCTKPPSLLPGRGSLCFSEFKSPFPGPGCLLGEARAPVALGVDFFFNISLRGAHLDFGQRGSG